MREPLTTIPEIGAVEQIAREAGLLIKAALRARMMNPLLARADRSKDDGTPITLADSEANELIVRLCKDQWHCNIVAEEGQSIHVPDSPISIVVDPLDGTILFKAGLPIVTVCMTAFVQQTPVLAVIYDPFLDRMFTARSNQGAFLEFESDGNKVQMHTNGQQSLVGAILNVQWWNGAQHSSKDLLPNCIIQGAWGNHMAGSALFGALVAQGSMDGFVYAGSNIWEAGAIALMVKEVGGVVTDYNRAPALFLFPQHRCCGLIAAATQELHDKMFYARNK